MKRLFFILLIIIIIFIFISINLLLIKKFNENEMVTLVESTINVKKEQDSTNNETKALLNMERIVVVLPNNWDFKEEIKENEEQSKEKTQEQTEVQENKQNDYISPKKYYIKVNYGANVVTVYSLDENNQYTVPVKAMVCSTGTATPTSGVYGTKLKWEWLKMFGNVYGYYTTQIVGNILFHSVPYLEKGNPASLEYWEYDKLGTSCSAGCIRLTVADAKWIYNNVEQGTLVEFYSSSDPGPLRKTNRTKNIG